MPQIGQAGQRNAIVDRLEIPTAAACFPKINHEKVKIGSID